MMAKLLHFLLAEDDEDHAELILRSLKRHRVGNTVDHVFDGVEAMEYLRGEAQYVGKPRPDVLLLDLNMPRMGGHEVLMKVKEDPVLCTIPIVILTTSDAESDRLRAYRHHANSYLVKPLDYNQFSKMVDELGLYWGVWNRPCIG
jgi:CheY-like chemotaxis protein